MINTKELIDSCTDHKAEFFIYHDGKYLNKFYQGQKLPDDLSKTFVKSYKTGCSKLYIFIEVIEWEMHMK